MTNKTAMTPQDDELNIVLKKTCIALVRGNTIVASFTGSDAEKNARILKSALTRAHADLPPVEKLVARVEQIKSNLYITKQGEIYEHARSWNAALDAAIAAIKLTGERPEIAGQEAGDA